MILLESLVAASCFYGNSESCQNGLQAYVSYYKLDQQAQVIGDNIKKKYPEVYVIGIIGGSLYKKQYRTILHKNIEAEVDFIDPKKEKVTIFWKYSY